MTTTTLPIPFLGVLGKWVLGVLAVGLFLRYCVVWMVETAVHVFLVATHPGVLRGGRRVRGPRWALPNGHILDKMLHGQAKSEEWRQYGPVYRIWAGPHPEIVITTPEDLKVFHSDSELHSKPKDQNLGWFVGQVLGSCVGQLNGDDWRRGRSIFGPPFQHGAAVARIADTERAARTFVESLPGVAQAAQAAGASKGMPKDSLDTWTLHAATAFVQFPFFCTAEAIYGALTDEERTALWALAEHHTSMLPYFLLGGPYRMPAVGRFVHPAAFRRLTAFQQGWRQLHERMVARRRSLPERYTAANTPLLAYWADYEAGHLEADELLHTLDEVLMANLDVTTHVLTWCITLIADDAAAQAALRTEMRTARQSGQAADWLAYLGRSDTHLHRCLYESLRLRPLTVFNIGESAPSVKDFHGVLVEPNTMVLVDVLAINVRNPFWGPDSASFRPDRFKTLKPSDLRYNLTVFGYGHRKCMGQYFGAHMIKAAVAHLFAQFDVRVTDGRTADGDYQISKLSWVPMADVHVQLKRASE